jgi:hypothetical protein
MSMQFLALSASLVIAVQIIYSLVNGSTICPNEGCELVERLTALSPLYFNILGLLYFQLVYWSLRFFKNKSLGGFDLSGLLLLAGLAVEGVLLAYQLFVAHVVCSYCILIFLFVILLNLVYGRKQLLSGVTIVLAILFSFSILTFLPARVSSQLYSLDNGSYGVKSCAEPSKKIYLIFSSDCSHCVNVIKALENCNSCDFYLNPIEKIDAFKVNGLELAPSYSPEVNRLMLAILGIKEIPVLVVKNTAGFSFIKGEDKILNYVRHACFDPQPVLYFDQSFQAGGQEMTVLTEDGGECTLDIDCTDQ